jgi:hypothetical protein
VNHFKPLAFAIAVVAITTIAWTQEPRQEAKPEQQEVKPPKEQPKENSPKLDREQKENGQPNRNDAKPAEEQSGDKAQSKDMAHDRHAKPAGKSAHIPDDKFKSHFGKEHTFTVTQVVHEKTVQPGQTRFIYGGYSFIILDPWPSEWLLSDSCYVEFVDDEYFLFDVLHPGIRVALFVAG